MPDEEPIVSEPQPVLELIKGVLDEDLTHAREAWLAHDTQSSRRAYIRTYAIALETMTHAFKALILQECANGRMQIGPEEGAALVERAPEIRDDGTVRGRRVSFRTAPNLLFTLRLYERAFGFKLPLDVSEPGWRALLAVVAVRNRLTHPKTPADLEVSVDDLRAAVASNEWLVAVTDAIRAGHDDGGKTG